MADSVAELSKVLLAMNLRYLFLLLFPVFSFAQTITMSEDITLRNDISYEILGELKGQLLLFRNQTTKFEVRAFDQEMKELWTKELDLDKRYPKVLGLVTPKSRDGFHLIYQFKQRGTTKIKAHFYDPAANVRDSTTIKDFGYLFYTPNFQMVYSEDRTKILVYFVERLNTFRAFCFDLTTMKLVWERGIEPDKINFVRDFRQVVVDNQGNMRLIFEKFNFKAKVDKHHFEIHEYNAAADNLRLYRLAFADKMTYDMSFTFDNLNNRLISAGLYSDKNIANADGYFYMNVNPDDPEEYLLTFTPFEDAFVANLIGKDIKKNKGISEIVVQEIVLRRDGGLLLIIEKNRQFERRIAGSNRVYYDTNSRYIVDYYFDELLVFSIHPTGKPHWKTVLHKKQYSQDDDAIYSSYFLFKTSTNLRFLFNDEIRQENTVSEYVLNGNGEYDRNSLLSTKYKKLRLRFRDAVQVNRDELVVPSERRNRLRLIKLEY